MKSISLLLVFLLVFTSTIFSQNPDVNDLLKKIKTAKEDTNKVNILTELSSNDGWKVGKYNEGKAYLDEAIQLSRKLAFKTGIGNSYNNYGIINFFQGNYDLAIDDFNRSIKIWKEKGDNKRIADGYNNLGIIYKTQGNYTKSFDYYFQALRLREESKDKKGMSFSYGNIGNIFSEQGDNSKALIYYLKALKINKEIGDIKGIASTQGNIANIYFDQGDNEKALNYYNQSVQLKLEIGDKKGLVNVYNGIGNLHQYNENYNDAISAFNKSLAISSEIGDKTGMAYTYNQLGNIYTSQNKFNLALPLLKKAEMFNTDLGNFIQLKDSYSLLSELYELTNKPKLALDYYKKFIATRDSIESEKNFKTGLQQEMQYNYDKKSAIDSIESTKKLAIKNLEIEKNESEIQTKKTQQLYLIAGMVVFLFLAFVLFNRLQITRKQKKIIEHQKEVSEEQKRIVETKNEEINASITYAKRIQDTILPAAGFFSNTLQNSFVYFNPKDVVSGDFYWLEKVGDSIYFAVADCTGHGVPGAMVSVVCSNALSKALLEDKIQETGKLLDRTRELVIQSFSGNDSDVKDGMDISLCKLDGFNLQWSGANNPLWILKNKSGEIEEMKANKQPIGKSDHGKPFTSHNIQLDKNDTIYLFSDGFADQFGGEKGKKYMYKPLKNLLEKVATKNMDEQNEILSAEFNRWKGSLEQVDDVCIIGVRL